ncbi:hypothetical protein OL548_23765 [Lysinibacillus sp. MHQ-1]|nr:hypothetical protein OL548_23765 [Lysinibacillus sp. MHQ-1]
MKKSTKALKKGWKMDGNEVVFWVSPTLRLSEYTGSIMNEFRFTLLFDEENKKLIVSGNNVKSRNLL